jgi:hypothetical protein
MKPRSFRPRSTAAHTMCDDADERHRLGAGRLHLVDRRRARMSRREHRVEHDRVALIEVERQLRVVLHGLEGLLVAIHPDEADPSARDEREHAVEHPDTGAQDRTDRDLLTRDPLRGHPLERRLHLVVLGRQVLRRLVGQEQRDLLRQLAEVNGRRRLLAQVAQLVLDERMRDDRQPLRLDRLVARSRLRRSRRLRSLMSSVEPTLIHATYVV